MSQPEYIGDGVYIQHIDSMLTLTTGRHMPTNERPGSQPDNAVYLEPPVIVMMLRWAVKNDPTTQRFLRGELDGAVEILHALRVDPAEDQRTEGS